MIIFKALALVSVAEFCMIKATQVNLLTQLNSLGVGIDDLSGRNM